MTSWLHLIGNQYGINRFVREAGEIGIQRAVPISELSTKEFGDTVYLGIFNKTPTRRNIVVFGYFKIQTVSVVRTDATAPIIERLARERHEVEMVRVERVCGAYSLMAVYRTEASLHDYYEALRDIKGAKVLIGAPAGSLQEIPKIKLKDATFFRGYRKIRPLIEEPTPEAIDRLLYELDDYHLS